MAANPSDSSSPNTSQFISTMGLTCPECDYNLTGLTEYRCPECGTPFDPDHLRELLAGKPGPIPGWGDIDESSVVKRYWRTCLLTWFHPREFGRQFPWSYGWDSVLGFWLMSRITTLVMIWFIVAMAFNKLKNELELSLGLLGIPWMTGCGAFVCELLVGLALNLFTRRRIRPSQIPPNCSSSWLGMVWMYGTFQPLGVVVIGIFTVVALHCHLHEHQIETGQLILLAVMWAWWSSALGVAVSVRVKPSIGVVIAQCLIPVLGVLSMLFGGLCRMCCGGLF